MGDVHDRIGIVEADRAAEKLAFDQAAVEPLGGLFVFSNRRRSAIKMLMYDGGGYWMCQKRLSSGRLAFWPDGASAARTLEACELQVLLMGGDPARANVPPPWRRLQVAA